MAKALLGHVGPADPRMLAEVRRLTRRVRELEAEVARLRTRSMPEDLGVDLHHDLHLREELLRLSVEEPALT